jgi:hypothetical protein
MENFRLKVFRTVAHHLNFRRVSDYLLSHFVMQHSNSFAPRNRNPRKKHNPIQAAHYPLMVSLHPLVAKPTLEEVLN